MQQSHHSALQPWAPLAHDVHVQLGAGLQVVHQQVQGVCVTLPAALQVCCNLGESMPCIRGCKAQWEPSQLHANCCRARMCTVASLPHCHANKACGQQWLQCCWLLLVAQALSVAHTGSITAHPSHAEHTHLHIGQSRPAWTSAAADRHQLLPTHRCSACLHARLLLRPSQHGLCQLPRQTAAACTTRQHDHS